MTVPTPSRSMVDAQAELVADRLREFETYLTYEQFSRTDGGDAMRERKAVSS